MEGESSHQQHPNKHKRPCNPTSYPAWVDLPDHHLENIALTNNLRIHINFFRGVCKDFRRSVTRPSKTLFRHPKLRLPAPIASVSDGGTSYFTLQESTVYLVQPRTETRQPWLVKVQEFDERHQARIKNILSKHHYRDLFQGESQNPLNLFHYRVEEIAKAYELELVPDAEERARQIEYPNSVNFCQQKVIVTSPSDILAENEFSVMTMHDAGAVHVWRSSDPNWTSIRISKRRSSFEDILYFEKKFYVLDHMGHTIAVHPRTLEMAEVASPVPNMGTGFKYLVSCGGELFMIYKSWREDYPRVCFRSHHNSYQYPVRVCAYKLDKENRRWVRVRHELRNRIVFAGEDCSFSLTTDQLPGCKGNYACLVDIVFAGESRNQPGWNIGVGDLNDGSCQPIRASRYFENLIWPPPRWLKEAFLP